MRIYTADLRVFADEQALMEKCSLLPKERRERIERYRSQADKRRGIGAGLLLEYGLRKKGYTLVPGAKDKTLVHIQCGEYGKPYVSGVPGLHFNLSHAGDYAAAVFAEDAVGIDIECVRTANLAVAARFFTVEEHAFLQSVREKYGEGERLNREFIRIWTRKESYIKAVGEGMHLPLADFCVLSDMVSGDAAYRFKSWELSMVYALSVCARGAIEEQVVPVDLAEVFDGGM